MKGIRLLVMLFSFIILLTGCGSGGNAPTKAESAEPKQEQNQNQAQGDVRSIEHLKGTQEIKGTPKRIVALEWSVVEDLLALGIQPVGVAELDGYDKWVNVKHKLDSNVVDVGGRVEPNIEVISSLEPDLIIGVDRIEAFYDELQNIAPTLLFHAATEQNPDAYALMEKNFRMVANAVNKQEEGEKVLQEVNGEIEKLAQKVKELGKADSEYVLVQAYSSDKAPVMRFMVDHAMSAQVFNKLGMKNAFQPKQYVPTFEEGTAETLLNMKQVNFFYIVQDDDNIFENQMKENPVWKNLDFVKENRTYAMGGDTWLFGGPLSAQLIAEKAVAALSK
ncbi:iron-siderophore ABC transporter substrate-binding protein [Paenibacillus sp. SC116]|uniref:ABC transporter substrate-binding protein n=1 Tax=Paenibacillus sp. SC116 TaxID=2968986 RepID=UPI00215A6429|nr:iron-siderophore ABC transporter substrate-binding protein [Paenibacillus sp. SC116]MCR8844282.1 iron-siderophore ABC transporter substrate-binding protein [Paenibacillus sp. SC116]